MLVRRRQEETIVTVRVCVLELVQGSHDLRGLEINNEHWAVHSIPDNEVAQMPFVPPITGLSKPEV